MRVSTKFSVAVHTVLIIAMFSDKKKISSDKISLSTGVNAVIIRNIFKSLKKSGIIAVAPGPGGAKLARKADSITLWDIFTSIEAMDTEDIFKFNEHVSKYCPVGRNNNGILKTHLNDAVEAMKRELSKVTVFMIIEELQSCMPNS